MKTKLLNLTDYEAWLLSDLVIAAQMNSSVYSGLKGDYIDLFNKIEEIKLMFSLENMDNRKPKLTIVKLLGD